MPRLRDFLERQGRNMFNAFRTHIPVAVMHDFTSRPHLTVGCAGEPRPTVKCQRNVRLSSLWGQWLQACHNHRSLVHGEPKPPPTSHVTQHHISASARIAANRSSSQVGGSSEVPNNAGFKAHGKAPSLESNPSALVKPLRAE